LNPDTAATAEQAPAQLAKAALRRLATQRLEPTPENYERAYRSEAGGSATAPAALAEGTDGQDGEAWSKLISRAVRGVERGGRNWTAARKKDSLQRVLASSRSDARRLQQRLQQLMASWESDAPDDPALEVEPAAPAAVPEPPAQGDASATQAQAPARDAASPAWSRIVNDLGATVRAALPESEPRSREVAQTLGSLQGRLGDEGPDAVAGALALACIDAQRVLQHRQHVMTQLGSLCHELTEGLVDLAEDDSWVRGQCDAMRSQFEQGLSARGVRAVSELLRSTRERQRELRVERAHARDALKALIHQMLQEIGELGQHTGRFESSMGRYAEAIGRADSLESLAGTVREMVAETRSVQGLVNQTQQRLQDEHARAAQMQERVQHLEDEIRRLSSEVSTDPLTQVANRRGLLQAFEVERSRVERSETLLSVALIDIDNFKRLNDQLGHASGDDALRFLTDRVGRALRPSDTLARYGGEEFVVLLPDTPVEEAQQVLTRVQRMLSAELFMTVNESKVFVTFSAGVTPYRPGERIEEALERADEALYQAKHAGKNRTCIG